MGNRKAQPEKSLGREQQEGTIEFHERNRKAETQEGRYGETPKNKTNSGNQRGIPARGKMLESYQIIKTIGAGSMGKVKQAVDTRTGRKVAIKIIPRLDPKVSVNLPKYHIDNSGLATTKLGNASGISVDSGKG
ncbi:Serine/threonine-protein kinase ppk25 [Zancudomyces culisetae]|uniref:Serine/threonine-protein kinase ppk25 n=1 Tax=Zancudomyces culisetae TaxID=1213189 RepID=A0A1R1PSY5_ZANCU|nr:Serine/threonine-protein kinase ppk25 [Zancudomyces culisetae]|eukprot:OMH84105.1 Serine/threonine-protein kinase ppk25 [Zancudomyces culisetae]